MGAEESKPLQKQQFFKDFPDFYKQVKKINHPVYGQGVIYVKNNTENFVFEKQLSQNHKKPLWKPVTLDMESFVECIGWKQYHDDEMICGENQLQKAYFSYYGKNLDTEIQRRQKSHEYFKESEIWFIFYSLIKSNAYLQQNGLFHGDIRPQNILVNTNSKLMLAPFRTFNEQFFYFFDFSFSDMTGYLKALKKNENVYLSPEGLQNLGAKILEPTFDYSLNDVFSVGITMLECMSLRPGYSFYNFQQKSINEDMVRNNLEGSLLLQVFYNVQNLLLRYSNLLVRTVAKLFAKTPEKRMNFEQIFNILEPYQDQIESFQPFNLDIDLTKSKIGDNEEHINHYQNLAISTVQNNEENQQVYIQQDGQLTSAVFKLNGSGKKPQIAQNYSVVIKFNKQSVLKVTNQEIKKQPEVYVIQQAPQRFISSPQSQVVQRR